MTSLIDPLECDECKRMFKDPRGLSVHKRRCRGNYDTTCSYCNQVLKTVYNLEIHLATCSAYKIQKTKDQDNSVLEEYKNQLKQREQKISEYEKELHHLRAKCISQEREIFSLQEEVRIQQKYLKNIIVVKTKA